MRWNFYLQHIELKWQFESLAVYEKFWRGVNLNFKSEEEKLQLSAETERKEQKLQPLLQLQWWRNDMAQKKGKNNFYYLELLPRRHINTGVSRACLMLNDWYTSYEEKWVREKEKK